MENRKSKSYQLLDKNSVFAWALLLCAGPITYCHSQSEIKDATWVLGNDYFDLEDSMGGTIIKFEENLLDPDVYALDIPVGFIAIACLSDDQGNLTLYSNGCELRDGEHSLVQNGDSINFDIWWDNSCPDIGYNSPQGIIFLPFGENFVRMIHRGSFGFHEHYIQYSNVVRNSSDNSWSVPPEEKNVTFEILNYWNYSHKMMAVRHANGRDWWLIMPIAARNELEKSNVHQIFLIEPDSIYGPFIQEIGPLSWMNTGQAAFSADGEKYIRVSGWDGVDIFDFDRCEGILTNPIHIDFPRSDTIFASGVATSRSGRFLYVSAEDEFYQYDLWASDIESSFEFIDQFDGFYSPFATLFYHLKLALNDKIYMSPPNGVNVLHIIHNPEEKGKNCNFEQHGLWLPTRHGFALPNAPHYSILDVEGSICDSLGINAATSTYNNKKDLEYFLSVNPTISNGHIKLQLSPSIESSFSIHDGEGRIIFQKSSFKDIMEIDFSGYSPGIYFVCLRTKNGDRLTAKFIRK